MSATTLSCPECSATLKSGTPIPAGRKIKCPKCSAVFAAPAPDEDAPVVRKKVQTTEPTNEAPGDDGEDVEIARKKIRPSMPAEQFTEEESPDEQGEEDYDEEPIRRPARRRRKRRTNTTKILAVSIGSALIVLILAGGIFFAIKNYVIDKGRNKGTGKETPLAFVPADSSFVLGMDLGPVWEQPALAAQVKKALGQDPQGFFADIKKNTGIEDHELFGRVIVALNANPANPRDQPQVTFIIHSKVPFSQNKVRDSAYDLKPQKAGGKTYYQWGTPGAPDFFWLFMPSDRFMILSNLPEKQMQELVESDGTEPKLPAQVTTQAQGLEKSAFWLVLSFNAAMKQQLQDYWLPIVRIFAPELSPLMNALPQAKMLTLSSTRTNDKISLQVSLVCGDEGAAKEVATGLQNYWDKNSKGQAALDIKKHLADLKELQPTGQEMLENLHFSSQGATAQASTQFTAPSADTLAMLITRQGGVFAPRGGPGGQVPGGPQPGFRFRGPPGGFKKPGA